MVLKGLMATWKNELSSHGVAQLGATKAQLVGSDSRLMAKTKDNIGKSRADDFGQVCFHRCFGNAALFRRGCIPRGALAIAATKGVSGALHLLLFRCSQKVDGGKAYWN